jgi:hypothetical protein
MGDCDPQATDATDSISSIRLIRILNDGVQTFGNNEVKYSVVPTRAITATQRVRMTPGGDQAFGGRSSRNTSVEEATVSS